MNPNSRLWLCRTNLENDYKNTLTFSSLQNQQNYFLEQATKSYTDYTYLRLERYIKVDDLIDNIDSNNYLVLLNNSKYYYYFITSMEYIDDFTTRINIELDVIQTYFFEINYKQTFIEREHVTDDIAGNHTIPEGLETGDFIVNSSGTFGNHWDGIGRSYGVILALTDGDYNDTSYFGGIYSGLTNYYFHDFESLNYLLNRPGTTLRQNAVNVYMYPSALTTAGQEIPIGEHNEYRIIILANSNNPNSITETILNSKPTSINGYTPRNKKLLTGEYNYLLCTNGVGLCKTYNYEYFSGNNIQFKEYSTMTPGGSILHVPMNYKGNNENQLESFPNAKFPICSWSTDGYTNWLTQNGVNSSGDIVFKDLTGLALAGVGSILSPMVGATLGASSVLSVLEDVSKVTNPERFPDTINGNINSGDVVYSINKCKSLYYQMSIKREFAESLDKFFDQFGYKVNIVKTPNIHTRVNWNYLKTKNCNFTGNIPQNYMNKIKSIFDNGITFWHNPATMLDYTQANGNVN